MPRYKRLRRPMKIQVGVSKLPTQRVVFEGRIVFSTADPGREAIAINS